MSKNKKKKQHTSVPSSSPKRKPEINSSFSNFLGSNNFYFILLGIVVLTVTIVRWRLAPMPLERDEGEYAYFGHLILNGKTPYQEAYNMKLPGIYYMYALIMAVFGETYKGIHIGFLVMNAGTMCLLYFSFRNFFNPMTGLITAGFYGLMAMSNNVLGFAAHATHFAVFYVALGLLFLAPPPPEGGNTGVDTQSPSQPSKGIWRAFLTGAMLGMAFLMKQQAVYFILFGGIMFLTDVNIKSPLRGGRGALFYSLGAFVPYIIVLLVMLATGTFDKFWFWTVQYAGKYVSGVPWESGKELLRMTFSPIWEEHKWIYILAMAGAVIVLFTKFSIKQKILSISFALFGILATTPGFFFRQHYFIVALPGVALLAGIAIDYAGRLIAPRPPKGEQGGKVPPIGGIRGALAVLLPLAILFFLFNNTLSKGKFYYSTENPVMLCKAIYGTNPFTESVEIANYIKANSNDTDKIAVLGSEPQIPFYANRKSATGHIYTYGLMEIHEYNLKMQEEMISEIEKAKPLFLVFVNVPFSWLTKPDSPKRIFEWYNKYSAENYTIVGLADIPDRGPSSFYWNEDAKRNPKNQNSVWVFKRK